MIAQGTDQVQQTSGYNRHKRLAALLGSTFLLCSGLALNPAQAAVISWINPATGDWFEAGNWSGGAPTAADSAFISNGGTAQAAGLVTPSVGQLHIGAEAVASAAGTVSLTGLDLEIAQNLRVGVAEVDNAVATGALNVEGSVTGTGGGVLPTFTIGQVTGADGADASGTVTIGGDLTAQSTGAVGVVSNSEGSNASGSLSVGGSLSGISRIGMVVNPTGFGASTADGTVIVENGDVTLAEFSPFAVGYASNGQSTAQGTLRAENGILSTRSTFPTNWDIGVGNDGQGTGSVVANGIDTSAAVIGRVNIGFGGNGGMGIGEARFGSGDFEVDANVLIGAANADTGGVGQGSLHLGGTLRSMETGNFLAVGYVLGSSLTGLGDGQATGTLEASGIEDFRFVWVGVSQTHKGQDASASGTAVIGSGGIVNALDPGGNLIIGAANSTPINSTIEGPGGTGTGHATVQGDITGYGLVEVGMATNSGVADGTLHLQNGALATTNLTVGGARKPSEQITNNAQVTSTGTMTVTDGEVSITPSISGTSAGNAQIGVIFGPGETPASATGSLTLDNSAMNGGSVRVGVSGGSGNLSLVNGSNADINELFVGTGQGASGHVIIEDSQFSTTEVPALFGASGNVAVGAGGGSGEIMAGNSSLNIGGGLAIGGSSVDGTSGRVALTSSTIQVAGDVSVGSFNPDTTSEFTLIHSTGFVGDDLFLGGSANNGELFGPAILNLDSSFLAIEDALFMDIGAETLFAMAGLDRGLGGYGAIDTASAFLNGDVIVDFGGLGSLNGLLSLDFDLIVADSLDAISGDFSSVSLLNLPVGYFATYGLFQENDSSIWRVTLNLRQQAVAAPCAVTLLALGLAGVLLRRRPRGRHS